MLLSEALSDYMYEEDSDAVKQAQQMGLVYKGFGRWADPQTNKVTHKTERGQLVPVDPGQQELPLGTPRVEPNKGIPGSRVDMPHGDPRQAGFRPQPPTEELPSQKEKAQKLATMLKNHDWHHEYSDDYSVTKRGMLEKDAIKRFVQGSGINPQLAQKVYDKFAHPDYQGKGQDFGIGQPQPNITQTLDKISSRMSDKDVKRVFQPPEFEKAFNKSQQLSPEKQKLAAKIMFSKKGAGISGIFLFGRALNKQTIIPRLKKFGFGDSDIVTLQKQYNDALEKTAKEFGVELDMDSSAAKSNFGGIAKKVSGYSDPDKFDKRFYQNFLGQENKKKV